jgi:TolA-binding protein
VVSPLNAADRAFDAGSYDEAARGYDDYLHANPEGSQRDHALFYFGLCLALRTGPSTDWTRAAAAFKELVDQHPKSPFMQPASVILSLRSELDQVSADTKQRDLRIKQLSTELDRLKKVDERRK